MIFHARQHLAAKRIGTDLVLYDLANKALHVLNMTAAKVFQLCDGTHTPEEIAEVLLGAFSNTEHVQVYEDVKHTLDILEERHLVIPGDKAAAHSRKNGGVKANGSLESSSRI